MDETLQPEETPAGDEEYVVVQTFEETHGWPTKLSGEELPPARLSLSTLGKLIVLPCCELLSWPRMLLLDALVGRRKPGA